MNVRAFGCYRCSHLTNANHWSSSNVYGFFSVLLSHKLMDQGHKYMNVFDGVLFSFIWICVQDFCSEKTQTTLKNTRTTSGNIGNCPSFVGSDI